MFDDTEPVTIAFGVLLAVNAVVAKIAVLADATFPATKLAVVAKIAKLAVATLIELVCSANTVEFIQSVFKAFTVVGVILPVELST